MKKVTLTIIACCIGLMGFAQDTESPTAPSNVYILLFSARNFVVIWDASTDNTAVTEYEIYLNGSLHDTVAYDATYFPEQHTAYADLPNGTYCYKIRAKDAAGNTSQFSNEPCGTITDPIYQSEPTELYLSGMLNYAGDDKAIEVTNLSSQTVNLSEYSLKISNDGSSIWTNTYTFPENILLNYGDTFVVARPNISMCANRIDDYNSDITNFDGNDVIGLFKYDVFYDTIGEFGNAGTITDPNIFIKRLFMGQIPSTTFHTGEWQTTSNNDVCPDYLGVAGIVLLDTEEFENNTFQIYPNPATENMLHFNTKNNQTIDSVTIFDINGRNMLTSTTILNNQLDIQNIKPGIYFLKIQSENKISTHKLIRL